MKSPLTYRSAVARYGVAVGAIAISSLVRLAVTAWTGSALPPFITFYPAVMVAAFVGGVGPGLLATALAVLLAHYWILPLNGMITVGKISSATGLSLFTCIGVFIATFAHLYGRARRKAAAYDRETGAREAREALRRSESRFRSLLDNADDMVTIVDPDGRILYESSNAERLFGFSFAEVDGKSVFDFVHPDDRAGGARLFAEAVAEAGAVRRTELRIRHKDGSWRSVDVVGRNLRDDPAVGGIVLNYRDVTERKRAEEALHRHAEKLEAANADLVRFNRVAVDRELRMIELKRQVNDLCGRLGEPRRYPLDSDSQPP